MWTSGLQQDARLLEKWGMYCELLNRRPPVMAQSPKNFNALRADFDCALLVRDEGAARLALAAMRDRFGLSAENRIYLEIRLFAGLEQWEKIAGHRLLSTLIKLNLPQETYGDILEGLYMADVYPFEQGTNLSTVLAEFNANLLDKAHPLFRTRRQSKRPAVIKSFIFFELLQSKPQLEVINQLLDLLPLGAWGPIETDLRQAVARLRPPEDPAKLGWLAFEHEQFDRAYELLSELPESVDVLRALIRCVDEARDSSRAQAVISRMSKVMDSVRTEVELRCPRTWPRVLELGRLVLDVKLTWAQRMSWRIEQGESFDAYIDRWREWARSAKVDDLTLEQDFGKHAAELLEHLALEQPLAFCRTVPLWHEVFVSNSDPDPQLKPVYAALLETLRLPDTFGDVELRLVRDVLGHLVRAGLTEQEYAKTLDDVRQVFERVRSPHHMRWALDVCDLLAMEACPDPDARLRLLSAVAQAGQEFAVRLGQANAAMLRMLTQEGGIDQIFPTVELEPVENEAVSAAEVGMIGIYSLDEAASNRAVKVLKSMYSDIDVRINGDAVCTPQLKSLAQRAAIFVIAWKTSKHAAYFCIKAASRSGQSLEMAQGAGTSSLVSAAVHSIARALESAQPA
jgi:hypothetical protein